MLLGVLPSSYHGNHQNSGLYHHLSLYQVLSKSAHKWQINPENALLGQGGCLA